jgi:hypothetical protein
LGPVPIAHFVALISPENSGLLSGSGLRPFVSVPPDGVAPFSEYWFSRAIVATMPLLLRFASPESM